MENNQFSEIQLFEGKNLSDLFQEIYTNSNSKRLQIQRLIESLTPLIDGIGDATLLVPLIKEYLEIGIKNDEQLVKLAQIVQRVESGKKQASGGVDFWSEMASLVNEEQTIEKQIQEVKQDTEETLSNTRG